MTASHNRGTSRVELSTALVFGVLGLGLAGWAPRVPDVKSKLGLSDPELGGALLAVAAGSMLFMPVTGFLIGRYGCRSVLLGASVGFSLALVLPALAQNFVGLVVALAVLGAALGALDVSANAAAAALERESGKQIMGKCHGTYSLGAIAGAIIGGLAAHAGVSAVLHLLVLGLVLAADEPAAAARHRTRRANSRQRNGGGASAGGIGPAFRCPLGSRSSRFLRPHG